MKAMENNKNVGEKWGKDEIVEIKNSEKKERKH